MKVTIENLPPGEEAEIIIRANTLSQRVMNLLHEIGRASCRERV